MDIDFTVDNAAHAAAEASRLLANDVFNEAYAELMGDIEKRLFSTAIGDADEREQLYHLHRASQMFVNNIAARINRQQLREHTQSSIEEEN
jgi:hypothetical protein